jgi:hypothetical protein
MILIDAEDERLKETAGEKRFVIRLATKSTIKVSPANMRNRYF